MDSNGRLCLSDFECREGVYFIKGAAPDPQQKAVWDKSAQTYRHSDKIEAIETVPGAGSDWTVLAGPPDSIWGAQIPYGMSVDSLLEIGPGYGRVPLSLSELGFKCKRYFGIDISEVMLRRLWKFKQQYNFLPDTECYAICHSADSLPLDDDSVDFVVSDSVFMHLLRNQLVRVLTEIFRVLRPGGYFIFNNSFHRKQCPAHVLRNLLREMAGKTPWDLYDEEGARQLLADACAGSKCQSYVIEQTPHCALLPEGVAGVLLPVAKQINQAAATSPWRSQLSSALNVYCSPVSTSVRPGRN